MPGFNTETLSTTSQQVVDAGGSSPNNPSFVQINNNDSSIVIYVGIGAAATAADGFPIATETSKDFLLTSPSEHLYIIAASGTPTCSVIVSGPASTVTDD